MKTEFPEIFVSTLSIALELKCDLVARVKCLFVLCCTVIS